VKGGVWRRQHPAAGGAHRARHARRPIKQRRLYLPGLTFPMLAAVTPPDCEVRIVNETVHDVPFDEPWDLVGVTGMGSGIVRGWQIADEFRRRGRTVVIGGIAATLAGPELSLRHADAVVLGEAEETWPRVVRDFQGGGCSPSTGMERRPPIDQLPEPRLDLLDARSSAAGARCRRRAAAPSPASSARSPPSSSSATASGPSSRWCATSARRSAPARATSPSSTTTSAWTGTTAPSCGRR
jgi:hypothetical protein